MASNTVPSAKPALDGSPPTKLRVRGWGPPRGQGKGTEGKVDEDEGDGTSDLDMGPGDEAETLLEASRMATDEAARLLAAPS